MLLDDRFVEAQREDVVAQLSARHKEQSSHELHPADSSWVGALQSQAPRVALSSWGNGTALATEPPPHCCSHSLAAATECAPRCLSHCVVWLVHRSGSIAFSLFAVLLNPRRRRGDQRSQCRLLPCHWVSQIPGSVRPGSGVHHRLYIAESPREPTLLRNPKVVDAEVHAELCCLELLTAGSKLQVLIGDLIETVAALEVQQLHGSDAPRIRCCWAYSVMRREGGAR